MIEIKNRRQYTSKTYSHEKGDIIKEPIYEYVENIDDITKPIFKQKIDAFGRPMYKEIVVEFDGQYKTLNAHVGHIHYFDKLNSKEFQEIDHKLYFDEERRVWTLKNHSFIPEFPEYSDDIASFRDLFEEKDQNIKYKAISERVKGELIKTDETNPNFDDNEENEAVLYKNAFGENRDLLYYNTRSRMVKVATVNNPNEQNKDISFQWEIELPDKELFRVEKKIDAEEMTAKKTKTNTEDGKLVGYKLLKEKGKNLNTDKLTLIGDSKLDGKEWYTYLKSFKAWDSDGNTCEIVARIDFVDGKTILTKTIPLEFLQSAIGRVFTDTTTSYYSGASDAWSRRLGPDTWNGLVTGNGTSTSPGSPIYFGWGNSAGVGEWSQIYRSRLIIDTSAIPDTDTITAATFYGYGQELLDQVSVDNYGANVYGLSPVSETVANASDFQNSGSVPYSDTAVLKGSFSLVSYNTWAFNSTGLAAISKTGNTNLSFRESEFDAKNVEPTDLTTGFARAAIHSSQNTGTDKDPYLEVTYSAGGTPTSITKSLLYKVLSVISATKALAYKLKAAVKKEKTLSYNIKSSIGTTKSLSYEIGEIQITYLSKGMTVLSTKSNKAILETKKDGVIL